MAMNVCYYVKRYNFCSCIYSKAGRFPPVKCIRLFRQYTSADRVINGVRFGKMWKHTLRGSQVYLRRQGRIELRQNKWQFT